MYVNFSLQNLSFLINWHIITNVTRHNTAKIIDKISSDLIMSNYD